MKPLSTLSEYQILFLARMELTRRVNDLKDKLIKNKSNQSKRRSEALLSLYTEQLGEIIARMAEINYGDELTNEL